MEEIKFVVTCNRQIKGVILGCITKEQAFSKFLEGKGIYRGNVKNIFYNEYEPYFIGFEYENEFYSLDGFYFDIFINFK